MNSILLNVHFILLSFQFAQVDFSATVPDVFPSIGDAMVMWIVRIRPTR